MTNNPQTPDLTITHRFYGDCLEDLAITIRMIGFTTNLRIAYARDFKKIR